MSELDWERDPLTSQIRRNIKQILFNGGFYGDEPSLDWFTRFWTAPYTLSSEKGLELENFNDHEITVSIRITELFLKSTDQVREVYYDTLLDQSYTYVGLMLISVSIVLTTLLWPMERKSDPSPKKP